MNEDDYAKARHGYEASEARDLVELAIDAALFLLVLASLTFTIFP